MSRQPFTPEEAEYRKYTAFAATTQIDALIRMLRREKSIDDDECVFEDILTSTLKRLQELNSVAMSGLADDHGRETAEMHEVVRGEPMEKCFSPAAKA